MAWKFNFKIIRPSIKVATAAKLNKVFSAAEIWAILESFSSYKDKFFIVILKTFNIDTLYMYKNRGKNGFLLNDPEITQNVPKFKNSPKLILTK